MKIHGSGVLAVVAAVLLAAGPAQAASVLFTGSLGGLSASVNFESSGSNLIVTLTNTSTADVLNASQVLTAVFFTLAGDPSLTRVSAVLASGSSVIHPPAAYPLGYNPADGVGVIGGEWAYDPSIVIPTTQGASSAGFGVLFLSGERFAGTNLQGPSAPDGLQYGITSAGDNPSTGSYDVRGGNALVKNSIVLTLSGLPSGFVASADTICNVVFQYGTDLLCDPHFCGTPDDTPVGNVPEPSGLIALLGMGLAVTGVKRLRRRRAE